VLDLRRADAEPAPEVDRICSEVGFFQVVGHGVPTEVETAAWSAPARFSDLPLDEKLALRPAHPGDPYGYIPVSAESLSKSLGLSAFVSGAG
jgi:isopenicillin N synthase-like dioxygenase